MNRFLLPVVVLALLVGRAHADCPDTSPVQHGAVGAPCVATVLQGQIGMWPASTSWVKTYLDANSTTLSNVAPLISGKVPLSYLPTGTTPNTLADGGTLAAVQALAAAAIAPTTPIIPTGATTGRTLANWFADQNNVVAFGAFLDGNHSDTPAFTAARAGALNNAVITVPATAGGVKLPGDPPTAGPTSVFWDMRGAVQAGTSNPYTRMGTDVVMSIVNGGLQLNRDQTTTAGAGAPVFRVHGNYTETCTSAPGAPCGVHDLLQVTSVVPSVGAVNDSEHAAIQSSITSSEFSAQTNAYATALYGGAVRPPGATSDGLGQRTKIQGLYVQALEQTDLSSALAGPVGIIEADFYGNGDDEAPGGPAIGARADTKIRIGKQDSNGLAARVGYGYQVVTADDSYYGTVFNINASWDTAGFDTSQGSQLTWQGTVSVAQTAPGTQLQFANFDTQVRVGMAVTGTSIPAGDTVASVDNVNNIATLTAPTTAAVPLGEAVSFDSQAPAYRIGANQRFAFGTTGHYMVDTNDAVLQYFKPGSSVPLLNISDNSPTAFSQGIAILPPSGLPTASQNELLLTSTMAGGNVQYNGAMENFATVNGTDLQVLDPSAAVTSALTATGGTTTTNPTFGSTTGILGLAGSVFATGTLNAAHLSLGGVAFAPSFTGQTAPIGGTALAAGQCTAPVSISVPGANSNMAIYASPVSDPKVDLNHAVIPSALINNAHANISVCAGALATTPVAVAYNYVIYPN